jgi:hypothetical protein
MALRSPRFLILSEPRTGSNNVSYVLGAHPQIEVGNELLHQRNGVKIDEFPHLKEEVKSSSEAYHWIASLQPPQQDEVCQTLFERFNGFKIHSQHVPAEFIARVVRDFECTVVLTVRRNLFEQAMSNFIAAHNMRWHADEKHESDGDEPDPFEIPPAHFFAWIELLLEARRSLWSALKPDADRVILCEYEAMFSGDAARRLARFQIIFDVLGIPRFGKLPDSERPLVFQKAMHFIDPQKQKMTDPDYAARFVSNYAEIAQRYDNWLMRSYGKTSLA